MDPLKILKALSNPHRLDIILWLKTPRERIRCTSTRQYAYRLSI